jgi:broad specificity phosphatase PhoE
MHRVIVTTNPAPGLATVWRLAVLVMLLWLGRGGLAVAASLPQQELAGLMRSDGGVLMVRHAYAPGTGDPDGFRLQDCTTQRNLSDTGREQARAMGQWLRARGITRTRVYSSQWCRCLETAELMAVGPVTPLPALNSFFEHPQDREPNLAALQAFLADQPRSGELLILVTHQVTISAITGEFMPSGQGVLLTRGADGRLEIAGQVGFAD